VKNAKADASEVAASLDVKLGRVISVSLDQAVPQPIYQPMMLKASAGYENSSMPIISGDVEVNASVTVTFEIVQ
jgi:uncharacterized protein YggE